MNKILSLLIILLSLPLALASPYSANAPNIKVKDSTSTNWAGYAVQTNLANPQNNAVTDVKGSWTVPSVSCSGTATSYSSFWVGIDGYSSNSVEQTGTDSDCSSGVSRYYAWYEMYPKFPVNLNLGVAPNDQMTAEVSYQGNGKFLITITDVTKGTSYSTLQTSKKAQRSSAEWIAEAPSSSGGVLPLANFGSVNFQNSQATINGITGTINNPSWQYDPLTMVTSSGATKASPSALSSGGSSFSVTWAHS